MYLTVQIHSVIFPQLAKYCLYIKLKVKGEKIIDDVRHSYEMFNVTFGVGWSFIIKKSSYYYTH